MTIDVEKFGQIIGKQFAASHARTDAEIEKAVTQVQGEMLETRQSIYGEFEKLHADLVDCTNDRAERASSEHVEQIQSLTTLLKAQEEFEGMLTARLAEVKDGEKGDTGFQGEPGLDGQDRPLLEPVQLRSDKDYEKNTLGTHEGGLWISTKKAVGNPVDDPHAWECILDSMTTMSIDLEPDKTFKLSVRMATGKLIENNFQIPFPEHMGIWEEGEYQKGNIVTKGSSMWLAQEDTDGEPPGNGWQQILSAPRGKQGPAGQSIEGQRGKPGRNGLDAKLPANFVDDLLAIASTNKAFEDGRSAAEAITSFRGYFTPDETYRRGDICNYDGTLFLCTNGGSFRSIAAGQDSWELMIGVPKTAFVPYMHWQGQWISKTYSPGMVVKDRGWTMVAKVTTNDVAAPYGVGAEKYLAAGATYAPLADTVKNVVYGTRVLNTVEPKFILGYKIDVIDTFSYRIFSVSNPLSATPTFNELTSFTATATETRTAYIPRTPLNSGGSFDIVADIKEPDPTPTVWTGDWVYDTPPANGIPLNGNVVQANVNQASLRISVIDNAAADRTAELAALSAGDTIGDGSSLWTITQSVDNTTWFDFTVSPNQQSPTDGLRTFTFSTTTPTAITIGRDLDFFVGDANVRGLLVTDGGWEDLVEDANAYSIDILYQDAYVSPDWEVVAFSGSNGEPTPTPVLTAQDVSWVHENSTPLETGSVVTSGAAWTEIARLTVDNAIKATIGIDAKRTDGVGYHVSEWVMLVWNDAGTLTTSLQKDNELGIDLSVTVEDDGQDAVVKVKGKPGQDWDWRITAFYRELH